MLARLVLVLALLLAGCAPTYRPPATAVWAYFGSGTAGRGLFYTPWHSECETVRGQDLKDTAAQVSVNPQRPFTTVDTFCTQVVITPGGEFFVTSDGRTGYGFTSAPYCELMFKTFTHVAGRSMSTCTPVAAKIVGVEPRNP